MQTQIRSLSDARKWARRPPSCPHKEPCVPLAGRVSWLSGQSNVFAAWMAGASKEGVGLGSVHRAAIPIITVTVAADCK